MSISNKIFESVAFKSDKELKESVETEQFIKSLQDVLSKLSNGNKIEGFATPEGCQLTFAIDARDPQISDKVEKAIHDICADCIINTNVENDDYVDVVTIDVTKPAEECDKVNEAGASLNIGADVDIPDDLASSIGAALLASEEGEAEEIPAEEIPAEEPTDEVEIKITDDKVEVETNKEVEVEVPADNNELDIEKPEEVVEPTEIPAEETTEETEKICEKCGKNPCECVDKEINEFLESAYESEDLKEEEVPASKVDFVHTQFEEVTNIIKTISELKAQDTENELYTDLLKAYDGVQKILKDYINDQPISEPIESEPAEEPVEAPAEEIEATEVEFGPEETSVEGE